MRMLLHGTNAPCYSCSMTGWNDPATTTIRTASISQWKLPSHERFNINMQSDSWNPYHPVIVKSLHKLRQRQSQLWYEPFEHHQQRGRLPRVFRQSTHLRMTKQDDDENDSTSSRKYRYPILDNAGDSTIVVVSVVVTGGLLLLLAVVFGSLEMSPSFLVVATTTITLFLLLRTIARMLILNDNDDDDDVVALLTDRTETDDDPVVPTPWQIDGATLILSYFISALLIPSDIIPTTTTTTLNRNEIVVVSNVTTTWPSVLVIVASLIGLGIWFNINIVRPTIEKERELTTLPLPSFTELLFQQWDQKFRQYLQQEQPPKKETSGEEKDDECTF